MKTQNISHGESSLTEHDIYLFKEGSHSLLFEKMGSHPMQVDGQWGTHFALWAPNAKSVCLTGDFNGWNKASHPLAVRWDGSGIWEGFIPGLGPGDLYKYHIASNVNGYSVDKGDPFAFCWEVPPSTASAICDLSYEWEDQEWMKIRGEKNSLQSPMSIYEVHIGSWRRVPEQDNRPLTYRELALALPAHVKEMGFTHVEFMPVMEHPFYGSWGYQVTGFFAPTSRYGSPADFMYLVDCLHREGIGVILDWVPSHFPDDQHGLSYFDGTRLFEHHDPKQGYHREWKTYIFNYDRHEVRSFLLSSAVFWLEKFHADGLRVDAVASMLYLDYGRKEGEWIPNQYGGKENLGAIEFLRKLNEAVYGRFPDTQVIAEESTAWPMVSKPTYVGGLGFGMKWNMGWMHDTLEYFSLDPIYRKYHHDSLTFSLWYAFTENFVLSLSHDEVVYGKGSLMEKMPGDDWQSFANMRLLLGYMYGHPGKKLLFMGSEFGQWGEWYHEESLHWHLLENSANRGLANWLRDLNAFYRSEPALYTQDFDKQGFEWVDFQDWEGGVLSFLRIGLDPKDIVLVVCNFTPVPRDNYTVGVPSGGQWTEALNSDAEHYEGSGMGNLGAVQAKADPSHGRSHSLTLTLPPLAMLAFKPPA